MKKRPTHEALEDRIRELEQTVSDMKKTEKNLCEYESLYTELFEHLPSGVAIYQPDKDCREFVFKAFNREAEKITKVSRQDVINRRLSDMFPGMVKTELYAALKKVCRTGAEEHIPPFYYKDEIREGWRENRIYRLPSGDVVAIFNDVTELKQAEQKILGKQHFLEQLMETSPVGITVVDRQGAIVLANRISEKTLGLKKTEIYQRAYNDPAWRITDADGNPFPPEQLPFHLVRKNGLPVFGIEHAIEWPDGRRILLSINAAPILDGSNNFDGMIAVIEDITERRRREVERENLIGSLQNAMNEVKTLSGLLPICSYCKQIRDDQGYWSQIESYLSKHSNVDFSHSICPECAKKYFPDYDLYDGEEGD